MRTGVTVIVWSLVGAVIAGVATFAGFLAVNHGAMLGPRESDEVQSWSWFAATMGSLGIAFIGLVAGAAYGIARVRGGARPPAKGAAQ